jgi:hypothetical protein
MLFLSVQRLKGVGGGLFIVPTSKRAVGESFHRTSGGTPDKFDKTL